MTEKIVLPCTTWLKVLVRSWSVNSFTRNKRMILTRKSSCVNARGIPTAAYQVLYLLSYPRMGYPKVGTAPPGQGRNPLPPSKVRTPPPGQGRNWLHSLTFDVHLDPGSIASCLISIFTMQFCSQTSFACLFFLFFLFFFARNGHMKSNL